MVDRMPHKGIFGLCTLGGPYKIPGHEPECKRLLNCSSLSSGGGTGGGLGGASAPPNIYWKNIKLQNRQYNRHRGSLKI